MNINNYNFGELKKFDYGLRNLGFDLYEAIMESIEDSIDANADNVNIHIFNETININIDNQPMNIERISYLIVDDGDGTESLKNIFDFGLNKNTRFHSIYELKNKNGIYHYGAISHLNVGLSVIFYSKTKDKEWKKITAIYDESIDKGFISNEQAVESNELNQLFQMHNFKIPKEKGSILYVKGVDKYSITYVDKNIEDINYAPNNMSINNIVRLLIFKLSIKYKILLENKINKLTLSVNNNVVNPNDIFLKGDNIPEKLRTPTHLATYKISLNDIINQLNDYSKLEILYKKYGHLYNDKNDLLNEYIEINLYILSPNFTRKKQDINYYIKHNYLYPSVYFSGLFVKRNNIYIGNTAKIMEIFNNHPSFNTLRGEISFCPIFDEFFSIQVNKNKYQLSNVLEFLIKKCIESDYALHGKTAKSRISNAIEENKNKYKVKPPEIIKPIDLKKQLIDTNKELEELEIYVTDRLLSPYLSDMVKKNKVKIKNIPSQNSLNISTTLVEVNKSIDTIHNLYNKINNDFLIEYKAFKNRVLRLKNSSYLIGTKSEYRLLEYFKEPQNEAEMYTLLVLFLKIASKQSNLPDSLNFKVLDYDYKDSIDNIIEIPQKIFDELDMKNRFNGKVEDIIEIEGILSKNLDITMINNGINYSFMEMKMKPKKQMNHPLRFVSHIIYWDKPSQKICELKTDHVTYKVDNSRNLVLFNDKPRCYIIYLKEIIQQISGGLFE